MAVLASACGTAGVAGAPGVANPDSRLILPMDPSGTATPTPFLPLPPTETPIPMQEEPEQLATSSAVVLGLDPWGDFPAPVEASAIEIPPPATELEFPEGTVHVIVLGSDQRPYEGGYRTDTMMLLTLNPRDKTVTMLSIPRDLYIYLPGFRVDRINTADVRGGFQMTADTIHYNFGIRPDFWVLVNFNGFMNAIDTLGGIDVQVTDYLTDECGRRWWSYSPGSYRMGGFQALCYVRMRKTSGDIDRLRRQQEVISGIFDRILSLDGLKRVPELYEQYEYTFQTNMELKDVLPLLPLAAEVASDRSRIQQLRIDSTLVDPWRVPYSGAAVLLPRWDPIQQLLRDSY